MSLISRISDLATALGTSIKSINQTLTNKVDKIAGKGLSTVDLTTTLAANITTSRNYIDKTANGAYLTGGLLTPTGGVNFQISGGTGLARNPSGQLVEVAWSTLTGTCGFNGSNFIGINYLGQVEVSDDFINSDHIPIAYLNSYNGNTALAGLSNVRYQTRDQMYRINNWVRKVIGTLIESGCNVSLQANPNQLKVVLGSGKLWTQFNELLVNDTSTFTKLFNSLQGYIPDTVTAANTINTLYYNDPTQNYTTALVPMTDGYYVKHLFFINPEGLLYFLYGITEYATLEDAIKAPAPPVPASISASVGRVATVVVQKNATDVAELTDTRPMIARLFQVGITASPLTVVDHGDLTGLTGTDHHTQYYTTARGDARWARLTDITPALALKADLDSPALTGTPTAPTPTTGVSNTVVANTQFVATAVANAIAALIDSSPALLDTLAEFAAAINNDPDYAANNLIALGNRVRLDSIVSYNAQQQLNALTNLGLQNISLNDTSTTANITDSTDKRFVTDAQRTVLQNTSGTNTGDETLATIKAKLGFASTVDDGYLKTVDWNTFNDKAPTVSPTFTGNPIAPTQTSGTNNTTLANTQFVTSAIAAAISALVDGSPGLLDTLNEFAAAIGNDPNYAVTTATALGNRLRVDAAQGLTAPQQTQARANLGLGSIALTDTSTTANITDSANKRFLTDVLLAIVQATSGTNTGDETLATIKSKLGAASTSTDGYLTAANWNTFNAKAGTASPAFTGTPTAPTQTAGNASTALATTQFVASAIATVPNTTTTANITDSTNKRFVTDALLAILQATSGTNTGDETLATIKAKLGFATTSVDGYLKAVDWTTFNNKAPTASPALTGTPTVPTQTAGTNNTVVANTQFVTSAIAAAISNLVNGAPGALDQLNEFATALGDDPNFAATITSLIGTKLSYTTAGSLTLAQQIIAKTSLALENLDNTSDANKPVSGPQATALATKLNKPTANGIVEHTGSGNSVGRLILGTANSVDIVQLGNGNYQWGISSNPTLPGTGYAIMPYGTTAERTTAAMGKFRYNVTLEQWEGARNAVWAPIGKLLQALSGDIAVQTGTSQKFYDNLAPDPAAGFTIFTATITTLLATSDIELSFPLMVDHSVNNRTIVTTVYYSYGSTNNVLAATTATNTSTAGRPATQAVQAIFPSPGAGITITITVKTGANGNGTTYINRGSNATMGNTGTTYYRLREVV